MPGNEVEDRICNLFELDNSSQGQHLPHSVDGSWSLLNDNQWIGKQRQSVVPLNFNLQNYGVQQLDSLRGRGGESTSVQYKPSFSKLTPRPENYRNHSRNYQLNINGSLLGNQSFQTMQNQPRVFGEYMGYDQHSLTLRSLSTLKSQPEYESGTDSPTLTANSERSEITEVSTDFNFLRGQQQLASGHQPGIPQPGLMQQSGYNDMQLLQQHMMFKQLQDLQRQQQIQQLGDVRQQNSINQLSAMSKQAAGIQFPPLNGTPINDASQMFMNWPQLGASSAGQGVANKLIFSPENGQPLRSMGHVPQPLDGSLYGTPVATARGSTGQYPQVQGIPQAQKSVVQSSGFSHPFLRDQFTVSPDQLSMVQGALISSQGFPGKNMFGDIPNQALNSVILSGNFQEGNSPQTNASVKEFSGRQEQTVWPAMQQKQMQHSPSLGLVPLDPVEEKILYNTDDTIWDASIGRRPDVGAVGLSSTLETTDLGNSFPSIQSGSWSALMQSAVAEASSSDTGLQEEWSGLTFQNTEQSTDNQLSNFMESENQPTGWIDNNLQSASSFSSKPLHMTNDSSMSSSFPGFQQPGIQFPADQREGLCQDVSHESMEKSPKVIGEWVDCNPQQKPASEASQQVQSLMHLNNAWPGQLYERSEGEAYEQRTAARREDSQMNFSAVPYAVMAQQTTNQQVMESNQSEYMGRASIPIENKEKESMGRNSQQIGNGPHVYDNSNGGECETYEKRHSYYQSENSNGSYNSKGLSGSEQGFSGQFQLFGNASANSINLGQGRLPHPRGNSRASEEVPSKGDITSVVSDGSIVAAQASQNMLELLHKVDQSRDDGNITPYGSADCNLLTKVPEAELAKSGSQLYNQPPTSQGFGLRLSPPSQRLPNSTHFLSSHGLPQTAPHLNSRQVNSELREKNQTLLASPSSVQTSPSHELSQRADWGDKSNASGQTGMSYLNKQRNSSTGYIPESKNPSNQPFMQFRSGAPVASQSSQEALPPTGGRYPLFNLSASQDNSRQMGTNHSGQQFPVLEAGPVSQPSVMSGISKQGDVSARPHNVWTNVPSQRPPTVLEHLKVSSNFLSSKDPSHNSTVSSSKGGYGLSEFVTASQHQISPEIIDASKHISDSGALASGSLVAHSHHLDLDRVKNEDNHAHGTTGRNTVSVGHSLESSPNLHQNYSLLDQVRAMKHVETDPSMKSPGVRHDSFLSRDANMMKFLTESSDDPRMRAMSQPTLQDRPTNETAQFAQNNSQNQSRINNLVSNLMEHSQVNPHMVPSLWKQFGTLKNGQMLPTYNAKVATGQFSLRKPSQNLQIHNAVVEQVETADGIQGGTIVPNAVAALAGTEHISAPYVLATDITSQSMAIRRPKKRKSVTSEPCPWHKEVTEGSQRVQNMSTAEECWTEATNRVIEKVEDEVEMAEDVQPMLRSKRRLILTTQLMQQLLCPAPRSILSADATLHHDSVIYFISRLSLGDACNFTCCTRNDLLVSTDNNNMTFEKLKTNEGTDGQQLLEVVDELSARAQKLENDFQRVEKTASPVDVRVECQELERFAVINRFAKFHIRAQADASGTSSSGPTKPFLQRYVTALPMPRKLPEGLQCISL